MPCVRDNVSSAKILYGFSMPVLRPNSISSGVSTTLGPVLTDLARGVSGAARGASFRGPVRMHPLVIGCEPAAFQSAQNDFMVRLRASAARRLPSGVCRPLPGAPPWLQQRLLGRPSSSATTLRWHGAFVLRACAMHRGHQRFRLPTYRVIPMTRGRECDFAARAFFRVDRPCTTP
jgi:hypothetical protein